MKAKPCQGFTLIELIMVIVLLAVISVYAASRYVGKSSFDAQLMEEAVLSSLRLTQLRAMNRSSLCGRWIVNGNQAIDMAASIVSGACTTTFPTNTNDSSFVDANEDGVSLTISSGNFIDFDSLGRPSQCSAASCTITIQGQSGTRRFICVNSEGGIFANSTSC